MLQEILIQISVMGIAVALASFIGKKTKIHSNLAYWFVVGWAASSICSLCNLII